MSLFILAVNFVSGFCLSFIFAIWGKGLFPFLVYSLAYEVALSAIYFCSDNIFGTSWSLNARFLFFIASLLGWICGTLIIFGEISVEKEPSKKCRNWREILFGEDDD